MPLLRTKNKPLSSDTTDIQNGHLCLYFQVKFVAFSLNEVPV